MSEHVTFADIDRLTDRKTFGEPQLVIDACKSGYLSAKLLIAIGILEDVIEGRQSSADSAKKFVAEFKKGGDQ